MKKNKVVVSINDNFSKSENVYNNVVEAMERMSLNKSEQIEYLKTKLAQLEYEQKNKNDIIIVYLISVFLLIIGIWFLILNFYTIGVITVFATFIFCSFKNYFLVSNKKSFEIEKFEDVEALRKIIDSKLK